MSPDPQIAPPPNLAKSRQLRQNEATMKRLILLILLTAILTAVCGVHAYVPEPAGSYSLQNLKTRVPHEMDDWIICQNNPVMFVDPDGLNAVVNRIVDNQGKVTQFIVTVQTEYVYDPNQMTQASATQHASSLENTASSYWNSQNISEDGVPVVFKFQHLVRSANAPATSGFDQINLDPGQGISRVNMIMITNMNKPNPVDTGTIFLGNQNNEQIPPLEGVISHEKGHQMGLPDLYNGPVPANNSESGNIMEFAQPKNSGSQWGPYILKSPINWNVRRNY